MWRISTKFISPLHTDKQQQGQIFGCSTPPSLFAWFGNFRFLLVSNNVIASTRASFPGCRWLRYADSPTPDSDDQRPIEELLDTSSFTPFKSGFTSGNTYSRIISTKSPSFCMTTVSARLTNLNGPTTSVTWLQLLRKQTNTGTSVAMTGERH